MSPQRPLLNRGMWRWLEESVRAWVAQYGVRQVITGPIFLGTPHWLQSGNVGIPREFFKIVVRRDSNGDLQGLAFLLIHGAHLPVPPGTQGTGGQQISADEANQYLEGRLTKIAAHHAPDGHRLPSRIFQLDPRQPLSRWRTISLTICKLIPNSIWRMWLTHCRWDAAGSSGDVC